MRLTNIVWTTALIAAAILLTAVLSTATLDAQSSGTGGAVSSAKTSQIARGKYLVDIMGCHDCHTPWKMGAQGPEPDMTRMLSGHPQDMAMTPVTLEKGPWGWVGAATNTAFSGAWGVSFTANLTPDSETGLGKWTDETFVRAIRTGRHEGQGRPILPPMPYPMYRNATDDDLRAVFAFLQSIPAIRNKVPKPIDPPETE